IVKCGVCDPCRTGRANRCQHPRFPNGAYEEYAVLPQRNIFPIREDGLVRYVRPLPWQFPTVFRVVNYEGPTEWTQYKPFYTKQRGGYEFTYPGGMPGADFRLFLRTDCGVVIIETSVDDPTPTPVPGTPTPTPTPPKLR
ncbi:MAG: alcohol dehydrogenase catalytic domain-containing protein, partial [Caldilineales bacterium]|nr:alcohol dehydrogenase catalytic domain-containing protein [Caldilineales bacterium]